ncbi:furin-like protease 2 [Caerostris extrusa]|uniref:Furin-like protease 2 n=1 Tax=Caerostris extrusa TaxID=172846 RepID=A0AAV4M8J8_CAEEX|nr:furin-like protease 2 [Caerostris extrusa]
MYKFFAIFFLFVLSLNVLYIESKIHTNEFAVHIKGGQDFAKEIADRYGFIYKGQIGSLKDYYLFEHHSIKKDLYHLLNKGQKRAAVRNSSLTFRDPLYPEQWFLHGGAYRQYDMNVIPAWEQGYTGKGVVVTILDDGIQSNHPDLAQNYDKDASFDINGSDEDPTPQDDDENKHGTRCAGEVAAVANNEFCGVGIAYNASIGARKGHVYPPEEQLLELQRHTRT